MSADGVAAVVPVSDPNFRSAVPPALGCVPLVPQSDDVDHSNRVSSLAPWSGVPIGFNVADLCQLWVGVPWVVTFRMSSPNLPLMWLLTAVVLNIGALMTVSVTDFADWICINRFEFRTMVREAIEYTCFVTACVCRSVRRLTTVQHNSGACAVQGLFVHWGLLASCTWVMLIAYRVINSTCPDVLHVGSCDACASRLTSTSYQHRPL